MRDQQQPKYVIAGVEHAEHGLVYQIERLSDRAVCGASRDIPLDDGGVYKRAPAVRQWLYVEDASAYQRMLDGGTAGKHPHDEPIVWIPHVQAHVPSLGDDGGIALGVVDVDVP